MFKQRKLTLAELPPSPVYFSTYEEFLALPEEQMLQVVNAVTRAGIGELSRLFSVRYPELRNVDRDGAAMIAVMMLAIGAGVARVTPEGRIEFDVKMAELETFSNVLVQNKVREAHPIIKKVTSNLMAELKSMVSGGD